MQTHINMQCYLLSLVANGSYFSESCNNQSSKELHAFRGCNAQHIRDGNIMMSSAVPQTAGAKASSK